ncbi:plasmid replication initiator TrfA [Burkholderia glumae]|uniref:plasmid replication initiator TrfA n=1 Tax=Burkholderia glumae TaxID=337 RepID=UPI00215150C1|nr:plasmid replication initiator TrfA [Burkholderia glumae]
MATWLHGYFASHNDPHPIKLETIRDGAGLATARIAHLRELVEAALDELVQVQFLKGWRIDGPEKNLVSVERKERCRDRTRTYRIVLDFDSRQSCRSISAQIAPT